MNAWRCPVCGGVFQAEGGLVACPHCGAQVDVVAPQSVRIDTRRNRLPRTLGMGRWAIVALVAMILAGIASHLIYLLAVMAWLVSGGPS